jgi:hypothetical protein
MNMKAAVKAVLRPVWRRMLPLINRVFATRREVEALQAGWHQHIPAVINAAASVGAVAREHARFRREHDKTIAGLRADIERLRGEFQMGASSAPSREWVSLLAPGSSLRVTAPRANAESVAAAMRSAGLEDVHVAHDSGFEIEIAGRVAAK